MLSKWLPVVLAVGLFVAYYAPIVWKLRDPALTVVVIVGVVLVVLEAVEQSRNGKR
jgi:hypothetical protein